MESAAQTEKRKATEEELAELRQQHTVLDKVCAILETDANNLAKKAVTKVA